MNRFKKILLDTNSVGQRVDRCLRRCGLAVMTVFIGTALAFTASAQNPVQ